MRDLMRRLHYSIHTERAYCDWVARFFRFHQMKVRDTLFVDAEKNVEEFLTHFGGAGHCGGFDAEPGFQCVGLPV